MNINETVYGKTYTKPIKKDEIERDIQKLMFHIQSLKSDLEKAYDMLAYLNSLKN